MSTLQLLTHFKFKARLPSHFEGLSFSAGAAINGIKAPKGIVLTWYRHMEGSICLFTIIHNHNHCSNYSGFQKPIEQWEG